MQHLPLKMQNLKKNFWICVKNNGMIGVKGHRSVGGFRVSMYNALPLSSVQAICNLMKEFNEKHADVVVGNASYKAWIRVFN